MPNEEQGGGCVCISELISGMNRNRMSDSICSHHISIVDPMYNIV